MTEAEVSCGASKQHEVNETESETYCSSSDISCSSSCASVGDVGSDFDTSAELQECGEVRSPIRHRALHWLERPSHDMLHDLNEKDFELSTAKVHSKSAHSQSDRPSKKKRAFGQRIAIGFFIMGTASIAISSAFLSHHDNHSFHQIQPQNELRRLLYEENQRVLDEVRAPRSSASFTLRLRTNHDRIDLIQNSIDSHSLCQRVKEIQVEWSLRDSPPESIKTHRSGKVVLYETDPKEKKFDFKKTLTEGVLVINDDLIFTCHELDKAFLVWNENPDRMVGFYPYHHNIATGFSFLASKPQYSLSSVKPFTGGSYSILSNRAAFVHRSFLKSLQRFTRNDLPEFCQSIILSLKVTSVTKEPPIAMVGMPLELRSSAVLIEKEKREEEEETRNVNGCMQLMMENFGIDDGLPEEKLFFVGHKK